MPAASKPLGRRLNAALTGLLMLGDGGAVDPARVRPSRGRGGHGKHGTTTAPPDGAFARLEDQAPVVRWVERFARQIEAAERELEDARGGAEAHAPNGDVRSRLRKSETRSILEDYVGVDPTTVAYIFRRTTEAVRKLRARDGRDPETGERVRREGPLTALPRDAEASRSCAPPSPDAPHATGEERLLASLRVR